MTRERPSVSRPALTAADRAALCRALMIAIGYFGDVEDEGARAEVRRWRSLLDRLSE